MTTAPKDVMSGDVFLLCLASGIAGTLFGVLLAGCALCHPLRHRKPRQPVGCYDRADDSYYILVEPTAVHVMTRPYFVQHGGLTDEWGKRWEKVRAASMEDALVLGHELRKSRTSHRQDT